MSYGKAKQQKRSILSQNFIKNRLTITYLVYYSSIIPNNISIILKYPFYIIRTLDVIDLSV